MKRNKKKKSKTLKRILLAVLILLLAAAAGIYFYVGYYYQDKFYSGTVINGYDCGEKTVKYISEIMEEEVKAYKLTVKPREGDALVFTSEDIGLRFEEEDELEKILKEQNSWFWILNVVKSKNYEINSEKLYDEELFNSKIKGMDFLNAEKMTAPADAHVEDNGVVGSIRDNVKFDPMYLFGASQSKQQFSCFRTHRVQ